MSVAAPPARPAASSFAAPRTVPFTCAALVVAGFASIALSWRGAAALLIVPMQTPYAVSGGAAGLALIMFGIGIAYVHVSRVGAAEELAAIDELNHALARAGAGLVVTTPAARPARQSRRTSERIAARRAQRTRTRREERS